LLNFAPDEACIADPVTRITVGSYPTFSPLPAGRRFISVALAVKKKGYTENCIYLFLPGNYPASFPKEPGLSSPALSYHQERRSD